jgi:hypothetical protein
MALAMVQEAMVQEAMVQETNQLRIGHNQRIQVHYREQLKWCYRAWLRTH